MAVPIVLADAEDFRRGVFANRSEHALRDDAEHVWVGEAQLRETDLPLAVDQAVVFRVLIEELRRGHEPVEGMHKKAAAEADLPAVAICQVHSIAVGSRARGEVAVPHFPPVGLAHGEGRHLSIIQRGQRESIVPRDHAVERRIPTATPVPLQEFIHPVERPSQSSPENAEAVAGGDEAETVLAQGCHVRLRRQHPLRVRGLAEQDGFLGQRLVVRANRQFCARHLADKSLQLGSCIKLRGRACRGADDGELGFALPGNSHRFCRLQRAPDARRGQRDPARSGAKKLPTVDSIQHGGLQRDRIFANRIFSRPHTRFPALPILSWARLLCPLVVRPPARDARDLDLRQNLVQVVYCEVGAAQLPAGGAPCRQSAGEGRMRRRPGGELGEKDRPYRVPGANWVHNSLDRGQAELVEPPSAGLARG